MTANVQLFPLAKLAIAPENARDHAGGDVSALAASIAAIGLIQPLSGYLDGDLVMIDAGGRRLLALQSLAKAKRLPKALKAGVPVTIAADRALSRARSIAENDVREAMHPADRIRAYAAMFDDGCMTAEQIASACAVTTTEVRRFLRLKHVAPAILDAFKAGRLSLDAVQAFSVSEDQAAQLSVFEALGDHPGAWAVKSRLQQGSLSAHSRVALFVGREAYEAAGGRFHVDLFNYSGMEETTWADADLAQRLAAEKLAAEAERVKAEEGWADVRPTDDLSRFSWGLDRLEPAGALNDEEEALLEACETTLDGESTEWEAAAADVIAEALERKAHSYSEAQRAASIAFVMIGQNGDLRVVGGFVEPQPVEADDEAEAEGETVASPAPAPAEADPGATGWGHGGHRDLTRVASSVLRGALLADPGEAVNVLAAVLAVRVLHYHGGSGAFTMCPQPAGPASVEVEAQATFEAVRDKWSKLIPQDLPGALAAVAALKLKERNELLAVCLGGFVSFSEDGLHHYQRQEAARREVQAVAGFLGIDFGAHWTPPADWLAKGSKPALLDGLASLGVQNVSMADKRADLAARLAREAEAARWSPKLLADLSAKPEDAEAGEPPAILAAE